MIKIILRSFFFIFFLSNGTVLTSSSSFSKLKFKNDKYDLISSSLNESVSVVVNNCKRKFEFNSDEEVDSDHSINIEWRSRNLIKKYIRNSQNDDEKEHFDIDDFDALLADYNLGNNFESFKELFREYSLKFASSISEMIRSVIYTENLQWIHYLFQVGYNSSEYMMPLEKRAILSLAISAEHLGLVENLLDGLADPVGFCYQESFFLNSKMRTFIENLNNSTRNFTAIDQYADFDGKLNHFRRSFLRKYASNERVPISMTRSTVLISTYNSILKQKREWSKGALQAFIVFEGEAGLDLGGLTREWIELLVNSFMTDDPSRTLGSSSSSNSSSSSSQINESNVVVNLSEAFFIQNANGVYIPNTKYSSEMFEFVGTIFALAFIFDVPIGVEFLPALYHKLAEVDAVDYNYDLRLLDPILLNGLEDLRKDGADLTYFEIDGVSVEKNTVELYISNQSKYFALDAYEEKLISLQFGFLNFIDALNWKHLKIPVETLKNITKGTCFLSFDEFAAFVNTLKLTDLNTKTWIFELIAEFTNEERLKLFKFITSRRCVPFKGLKYLSPVLSFANVNCPCEALPFASTCTTTLFIPIYGSKDILRSKLAMAINECTTFDLEQPIRPIDQGLGRYLISTR